MYLQGSWVSFNLHSTQAKYIIFENIHNTKFQYVLIEYKIPNSNYKQQLSNCNMKSLTENMSIEYSPITLWPYDL